MKIFCSTSNKYLHIVPIFTFLFNKFWSKEQKVTILGYNKPEFELPSNFEFVALNNGDQQLTSDYARHLREYFSTLEDEFFMYTMEDTFIKAPINFDVLEDLKSICNSDNKIGRIDLTEGMSKRDNIPFMKVNNTEIIENTQYVDYRISCQFSIWNKEYMIKYLKDGYTPWDFEIKGSETARNDGYRILGVDRIKGKLPIIKNEGVTLHDIYDFNFEGFSKELIKEMGEKNII